MQVMKLLVLLPIVAVSAAACASGGIQAIEDRPTLSVPPVPPRTIEPQPVEEPPRVEPIAEPSPVATAPTTRRPTTRSTEPKPDPKPEPTSEATTIGTTPPPAPIPPLRTPSSPSGPEAVRQVRDTLARAEAILARIDYQKLSDDRKAAYNSAKDFVRQAEEKVKQEDLQLALSFAQRAEQVAQRLQSGGR